MSLRNVLFGMGVTVLLLIAGDATVYVQASNSVPRQLIRKINSAPRTIQVLAIGNSLIAAGFDSAEIERVSRESGLSAVALNAGLGASGVIEHLILARLAFRIHTVQTVVYGFYDQQLALAPPARNADLIGNRSLLYYLEPQVALQYAGFDPPNRLAFQVYRCCALLRDRSAIWAKVEKLRRRIQEIGMPRQETNKFGRVADFSAMEAASIDTFVRQCQQVIQSRAFLSAPIQALLQQARAQGANVVVVEMPMTHLHVASFYDQPVWEQYSTKSREAVEREGATFLDASRWIPEDSLFADHVHLTDNGAVKFSRLLASYLIKHHLVSRRTTDTTQ